MAHSVSVSPTPTTPRPDRQHMQPSTPFKMLPPKKYAALPIDFVIVGGGIAGLSSAIALSRVGHRVTVLERERTVDHVSSNSPLLR